MTESLSSILSSAVQNIGKLVIEEGKFLQGVGKQVRFLHDDLKRIQRFLRYADTKQTARDSIQQWVPEFRAVAYEASDLVEDYALRVSISSNGGFTSMLKRIACIATEGYARHNLGVEIQSLRTRISNLTKNFGEYGHVMTRTEEGEPSDTSRQQQLRHTYSVVADEDVVELPNDVQVLVKNLLNEVAEHKISVASIYGMGGIGKTTLARKVYHHERLKHYFKGFAWVCVSQQWQPNDLLQGILLKLTPEDRKQIMKSKQDELARQLQQHLQDNKCLIVLDDLWSAEPWDCLKGAIPVSEHGSKILLTTRNEDVAAYVGPNGYHHKQRCLTEEESWELLRKKSLWESHGAVNSTHYRKYTSISSKMAEAILSSILSSAVENIGKLLIEEGNFLQGVSDQVRLLRDDLEWIQMFLRYVDTKQATRDTIQQCVPKFRAVAYEASDLVEDYALTLSISRNGGFTSTLKRIACITTEGYTRHGLGLEIQSLRTRISNLTKNFGDYGNVMARMEEGESSAPSRQQQLRRTRSFVGEEDVVELPEDVLVLVKYLLNEDESTERKISVASIFGMGGIGKTTLARKIYHHERLRDFFEGFAWVCVSQQWQPNDLLQGILLKLIPEQRNVIVTSKEDELARLLQQHLRARRCLVVVDDIWSTEAWDCLKDAILVSEHGSKILLTTRNRDVAAHVDPNGYHHQLRCLTAEESWELLRKKSLWESNGAGCEDLDKMEDLGKKMLKSCGGLPLAVVVLGGILRTKKTLKEWNEVHENIKSYLDKGEKIGKEGEVPKILAYSYYDLPWQLKPCFLYLGKFREDSDIGAESLYQMWIGEGMIFENDRREQETMMDVAERYLKELAIRCMVEIKAYEEGKHAVTKLESCQLHDLMRDLCLAKAKEENLYKLVDRSTSRDSPPATEAQYGLVLHLLPEDISQYNFPPKEQTKHLHSFMCDSLVAEWEYSNPGVRIMSQVKNLKMLRVLAILSFHMASQSCYLKSPLGYVGKFIHLRCLRLRGQGINLPYSLGNLKYLETLDLSGSYDCRIPNVLWKLERLRYLYLPDWWLAPQPKCGAQPKLRLSKQLEILESFDNKICYPEDVCKMSNLRAFKATVHTNLDDLERIINHISNSECLCISSLAISDCDFGWTNSNNSNDTNRGLDVLSRVLFSRNIHELEINDSLCKKLPNYQSHAVPDPAGLTRLELYDTNIEEDPMETLEKLPNLRLLVLGPNSFMGKEMICHSMGFPQLKHLGLESLSNLKEWKVDEGAMPKLSSLWIGACEELEMIPDGLRFVTTLKEVYLVQMPEEFKNRVTRENGQQGEDYDKISHVPSVNICS